MDLMLQTLISLIKWEDNDVSTDSCYQAFIGDFKLTIENHGGDLYCMSHDSWSWQIEYLYNKNEKYTSLDFGQGYDDVQDAKDICIESLYKISICSPYLIDWNDYKISDSDSDSYSTLPSYIIPDVTNIKIKKPIVEANEPLPVLFVILRDIIMDSWHAKIVCKNNIGFTIWDSRWVFEKSGNYLAFNSSEEALDTCLKVYDGLVKQS